MKKYPLVYIEWCDAMENLDGWHNRAEALDWAKTDNWIVSHVGWILKETKSYLLMTSQTNIASKGRDEKYSGLFKIPKPWIIKRKKIKL